VSTDPSAVRVLSAVHGRFDFRAGPSFALPYLATYYAQPVTIDESELAKFVNSEARRLSGRGRFIEVGCGPTLHHALTFAARVDEVHMTDYLAENLDQVRLWKDGRPGAHDWTAYTIMNLRHEGIEPTPANIQEREALVRARIIRIAPCNLLADTPVSDRGRYDTVGCFYVAEEVGISEPEWRKVMARVCDYVAPGGTLFMAALAGMDGYQVRSASGESLLYPCAKVTEQGMAAVLKELGFAEKDMSIRMNDIEHPDCGVAATLMVAATRHGVSTAIPPIARAAHTGRVVF